jgi:DNA-binding transcriptional MerR regulator
MNGVRGGGDNHPWAKTHWTRQEAADYLHVSKSTIITWEQRGILPFLVDAWGQRWFEPAEVRRVPPKRTPNRRGFPESKEGRLQAIVFQMFEDKVPFREIVKRLDITAQKVRALYVQSQYELDDVLPAKPEKVIELSRARLRVQEKTLEVEGQKLAAEEAAHQRRLAKMHAEEEEEARFEEKKKRLGTKNLRPEGSSDE